MTRTFFQFVRLAAAIGACLVANLSSPASAVVFSFGSNDRGNTGQGNDYAFTRLPVRIDDRNLNGATIIHASAGRAHNLLLAEDGRVFSFGENQYGATGLGTGYGNALWATPIITSNLDGRKNIQVSAGSTQSLLLADDGSVFSFGFYNPGRSGPPSEQRSLIATAIDGQNLAGRRITQVNAGGVINLLLADDGSVFSFGSTTTDIATPIDASNLGGRKITQISAGSEHALLLADDGSAFAFGENSNGCLGLGDVTGDVLAATRIDESNLGGKRIAQVAAGASYSLFLAEDGSVYSCGVDARAGLGRADGNSFTTVPTPIDASNLGGRKIKQISAGTEHALLLADDGSAFAFGSAQYGECGIGETGGRLLSATPIDQSNLYDLKITQVSAGLAHSLLIAQVPEPGLISMAGAALAAAICLIRHHKF